MREEWEQAEYEQKKNLPKKYVPSPSDTVDFDLLELKAKQDENYENLSLETKIMRLKRSVKGNDTRGDDDDDVNNNGTVIFHNTVNEVNEDSLKNTSLSGTLKATKIEPIPKASRRTLVSNFTSNIHIEHTPLMFNPHAADNRVDTPALHDDKEDLLVHHKVFEIIGNQSLDSKDKDLSKILVNEMKPGEETIGDENIKPVSNITFRPDNDTLTAVTFIAGNLLNKLWNMETDANENSMDAEHVKHITINNLLDLFKEPLNLRQETFLKHALEQISTVMENKEISNISLCEKVEKLKEESLKNEPNELKKSYQKKQLLNDTGIPPEALSKINNALDLISKYERVQKSLTDLKSNSGTRKSKFNVATSEHLTKTEEQTLNTFGNILGSITRLLLPNKKSKKIIKSLKGKSTFSNKTDLKEKLGNLNIDDLTLSDKDKIVLDYLSHIQNSPNCLLNRYNEKPKVPSIEGNILLNLSEFFKIKSMSDLLKLVSTTNKPNVRSGVIKETTIKSIESEYTTERILNKVTTANIDKESQFRVTKDKLKLHLKTILQDLIELQNISGTVTKGKRIELNDALPCIYNLLNSNRFSINSDQTTIQKTMTKQSPQTVSSVTPPSEKITDILNKLKKDLKNTSQTRRSSIVQSNGSRPKSAAVWERTIKNLKTKVKTRRSMDFMIPNTIEELKKSIDAIDTSRSNTYKTVAFLAEVPPAERLLLLKTLALDTYKYINVIEDIKHFTSKMITTPNNQYNIIEDFIDNVNQNIDLNDKVIKNLNKPNKNKNKQVRFKKVESPKITKADSTNWRDRKTVKLSREQILIQLIKNRINYYISLKEASKDGDNSINYDLAKKILFYLELGNYNLAKDLYKIFVSQNEQAPLKMFDEQVLVPETYKYRPKSIERRITQKVPLIQFEEPEPVVPKEMPWSNQDQLIKQLLTIQNMKA